MDPEELRAIFNEARAAVGQIPEARLNALIAEETNGEATSMFELSNLVRQSRTDITDKQRRASNKSVAVTTEEAPSAIPRALRVPAAGLQQFAEGATFGGLGELSGAIDALFTSGDRGEAFRQGRSAQEESLKSFQEERPGLSTGLRAAGGITSGILAPAAGGLLKSASVPGAIAKGVGIGAAEGGLEGALSGEGLAGRAGGAGLGALVGGALGGATGGLAGGAAGVGRHLLNTVENISPFKGKTAQRAVGFVRNFFGETDTKMNRELIGNIEQTRFEQRVPSQFRLKDHPAFGEMAERADLEIKQIDESLKRQALGGEGSVDALEAATKAAPLAPVQGALTGGRLISSILGGPLVRRHARQRRDALKWLQKRLSDTDELAQRDFMFGLAETGISNPGVGLAGGINPLLERQ